MWFVILCIAKHYPDRTHGRLAPFNVRKVFKLCQQLNHSSNDIICWNFSIYFFSFCIPDTKYLVNGTFYPDNNVHQCIRMCQTISHHLKS